MIQCRKCTRANRGRPVLHQQQIGGDELTWAQRLVFIKRMQEHGTIVDFRDQQFWWTQDRCGTYMRWAYYRGRWYCARCGRAKHHVEDLAIGEWHPLADKDQQRALYDVLMGAIGRDK